MSKKISAFKTKLSHLKNSELANAMYSLNITQKLSDADVRTNKKIKQFTVQLCQQTMTEQQK